MTARDRGTSVIPMRSAESGDADERSRRIDAVTDTALARVGLEELLQELLSRVRELLAVDTATVLLLDDHADELIATAADGIEEEVWQGVRVPVGMGFAGRIAVDKRPVILERVDETSVVNPLLWEKGIKSLLGVPLLAGGELVGVLHVGTLNSRRFVDEDVHVLQLVGDRIGLATQARLSAIQREAASALQRSLLPVRLPHVPGVEFASRYVPGSRTGVGGDWYDVFALRSGCWGVVIGDVAGHGLFAATVMGRLRSVLRAYAMEYDDPAETLDKLSQHVRHFESHVMATVAYAILDPSAGRMRVSTAGHLPPVYALPNQPTIQLDLPVDPPIHSGISPVHRRTSSFEVAPGALLLFYTDGLIECRGIPIDDRLEQLRAAVSAGPVAQVCASVMAQLIGTRSPEDDIAILVARRQDSAGQPA